MTDAMPAASYPYLSSKHRAILNLSACHTEDDLAIKLAAIISLIEFDFFHYAGDFGTHNTSNTQRILSNLPKLSREGHTIDTGETDPFFRLANQHLTPIFFDNFSDARAEAGGIRNSQMIGDIGVGVIFPIHAKNSDTAVLGFFIRSDRRDARDAIDSSLGEMSLTTIYLHDAMTRIVAKSDNLPKTPLTRREIECLQLIADYKSNWVISRIFGISEHAVVYYVRRLMWKLDAENRHQAVERASACGLI